MKYSIIIPTLNEEKLLPNLLQQLACEKYKVSYNFEIIVSDGSSTDSTIEKALPFADKIIVHNEPRKQNISEGRNKGAGAALGDILIFINGDVLIKDIDYFFRYIDNIFSADKYIAATFFVRIFPGEEKMSDKIFHFFYNNYFRILNNAGVGMGRGECQIVRRENFQKVNGYNNDMAAGEDFDLFRRLRESGKILFTNDITIYESPRRYRKLGYTNVTLSWIKNGFSVFFHNKSLSKIWEEVR